MRVISALCCDKSILYIHYSNNKKKSLKRVVITLWAYNIWFFQIIFIREVLPKIILCKTPFIPEQWKTWKSIETKVKRTAMKSEYKMIHCVSFGS